MELGTHSEGNFKHDSGERLFRFQFQVEIQRSMIYLMKIHSLIYIVDSPRQNINDYYLSIHKTVPFVLFLSAEKKIFIFIVTGIKFQYCHLIIEKFILTTYQLCKIFRSVVIRSLAVSE